MSAVPGQAVRRDIGLWEWFSNADTWWGSRGIVSSLVDTVTLCAVVTVIAAVVSIPVAAVLAHGRKAELSTTWLVSISRAVPTFAIAALLLPWSLRSGLGFEPWPIFISLLLLALVPIYLTTYTAITQVDRAAVDASRAMGYTEAGILWRTELALGSSAVLAGVRVAAIQVVATEPIRAFLGGNGLGRFVRDGFGQKNTTLVVGGIILIGSLAAATGLIFVLAERLLLPAGITRHARKQGEQ